MSTATKHCANLHHMPKNWRDEQQGNTIKTFCKFCGKFIGQRPVGEGKRK